MGSKRGATMTANPQRSMMQYEEKLRNETKGRTKWEKRYGEPAKNELPTLATASVCICVVGHPLEKDGTVGEILYRRLERGAANFGGGSTVILLVDADASMYPGTPPVTAEMKRVLAEDFNIPADVIFCRPSGLNLLEQAKDVSLLLRGDLKDELPQKSPIGVIKILTSDFNIVRARRCFGYWMKIYVSDEEVPSGLSLEDIAYLMDEEHRINREYRAQGGYDADKRS